MRFAEVLGQEKAKAAFLEAATSGRISHALLLRGKAGVGKLPLALAIAQYLNCQQPTATDSCGICPSCRKNIGLVHPDVHMVAPIFLAAGKSATTDDHLVGFRKEVLSNPYLDLGSWGESLGAENKQLVVAIQDIRNLKHKLGLRAYEGGYKVVILWHAEKINGEAANAFLKLLEEPPEKTILLLTLEEPAQLLPTLTSRCQLLPVERLTVSEIEQHLSGAYQEPQHRAQELAWLGEGSLGIALLARERTDKSLSGQFQQWMRISYEGKFRNLQAWAEEAGRQPKEYLKLLLDFSLKRMHDVLVIRLGAPSLARLAPDQLLFLQKFSGTLDPSAVEAIAKEIETALFHVQRNANGPLTLLNLSLQLTAHFRAAQARANRVA